MSKNIEISIFHKVSGDFLYKILDEKINVFYSTDTW